jgi:hypothetical protein
MSNKDLIKQYVSTGAILPPQQVSKLSNNNIKTYLKSKNIEDIGKLLRSIENPERLINVLLQPNGFISKLENKKIDELLITIRWSENIIGKLLQSEEFISKLDDNDIRRILIKSNDPVTVLDRLGIKGKEFIVNLKANKLENLILSAKQNDIIIDILFQSNEFKTKLDDYVLTAILISSKNPEKIIKSLGDRGEEFINKLIRNKTGDDLDILIAQAKDPEKVVNLLGDTGKELIRNLKRYDISLMFAHAKEIDKLVMLLNKYGHNI